MFCSRQAKKSLAVADIIVYVPSLPLRRPWLNSMELSEPTTLVKLPHPGLIQGGRTRFAQVYGISAGIKRKRIQFVPAVSNGTTIATTPTDSSHSAANKYLSIVLKRDERSSGHTQPVSNYESTASPDKGDREVARWQLDSPEQHVTVDVADQVEPRETSHGTSSVGNA